MHRRHAQQSPDAALAPSFLEPPAVRLRPPAPARAPSRRLRDCAYAVRAHKEHETRMRQACSGGTSTRARADLIEPKRAGYPETVGADAEGLALVPAVSSEPNPMRLEAAAPTLVPNASGLPPGKASRPWRLRILSERAHGPAVGILPRPAAPSHQRTQPPQYAPRPVRTAGTVFKSSQRSSQKFRCRIYQMSIRTQVSKGISLRPETCQVQVSPGRTESRSVCQG